MKTTNQLQAMIHLESDTSLNVSWPTCQFIFIVLAVKPYFVHKKIIKSQEKWILILCTAYQIYNLQQIYSAHAERSCKILSHATVYKHTQFHFMILISLIYSSTLVLKQYIMSFFLPTPKINFFSTHFRITKWNCNQNYSEGMCILQENW